MIVRYRDQAPPESPRPEPAFQVFLASQSGGELQAIVLQTMHSQIAGELARGLRPEIFGELPPEVIEAAEKHDLGWAESDDHQLARLAERDPKPFPQVGPTEELPSWERSLRFADAMPLLTRVLIARHFCALASRPTPQHAEFLRRHTARREKLESELALAPETLQRYTDALGFCDLLSLYLCSGVQAPAEFPVAHPAEPYAGQARKLTAKREQDTLRFSEPVFRTETTVRGEILRFDAASRSTTPIAVEWRVR